MTSSLSHGASGCTLAEGDNVNQKFSESFINNNQVGGDQINITYNSGSQPPVRGPVPGQVKKYFGKRGNDAGQMLGPHGISSTASDDLVVADFHNNRIQIFDVNGRDKGSFGSKGNAEGQFDGVADVCVTSRGRFVASDYYRNHRIQIFDEHGNFVRTFGCTGSGNGNLNCPMGVATDDKGLIYVCDVGNDRVQVFSEEGKFVRKFGMEKPEYLAVTPDGRVVVSGRNKVKVFDLDGRHLLHVGTSEFKGPRGIATDDDGNIIVAEYHNHRVQVFTRGGEFVSCFGCEGSEPGQMKSPVGVCVLEDGGIAVCDSGNCRVQIF